MINMPSVDIKNKLQPIKVDIIDMHQIRGDYHLTDKEALLLSGWANNLPTLALAYRLKEDFFKIYDAKTRNDALALLAAWEISVTHEVGGALGDLIRAWHNWQPYILNYFDHPVNQPITTTYTESLNNLIRVMNRLGRGTVSRRLEPRFYFRKVRSKKTSSALNLNARLSVLAEIFQSLPWDTH